MSFSIVFPSSVVPFPCLFRHHWQTKVLHEVDGPKIQHLSRAALDAVSMSENVPFPLPLQLPAMCVP